MLKGEILGTSGLTGNIGKEVIKTGGGDAPIKTISVDGVEVKPDSKKNVNIDLSGKVDKAGAGNGQRLYGVKSDGTENMYTLKYQAEKDAIPFYNTNGRLAVGTPTEETDATTKKYVDDKFNGANKAVSFVNYSAMISSLNTLSNNSYNVGQNIMIVTLAVPDLWVSEIAETSVAYTYVSDDDFINELTTNGYVQVGYYKLSALETQKVDLTEYAKLTDLGNKLDKVTTPYGASVHRIYAVGTQGQQYVITTVDSNNIVETKKHSEETYVAQQTPEFDAGATRGYVYYIERVLNSETGELDIVQSVKKVQIQANYDTIPLRNPNGNFYVGNPTLPYECTNLGTVMATQGTTAPTESTVALYVGELYYDTTNNKMYMCFGIDATNKKYTWTQIIRATDLAGNSIKGVVDVRAAFGMQTDQYGRIQTVKATNDEIKAKENEYHPIVPKNLDYAIVEGLTNNSIALTEEQKTAVQNWLGLGDINTALEAILGV